MANGDQQTVDYEALARKAGAVQSQPVPRPGNVDYAALAKQAGATDSQSPMAPGAIQTRKGGPVYTSPAEASAARDEDTRAGIEAAERGIAGAIPGGELGIGAVKGALSTGRNIGHLLTKTPVLGKYLASADASMATGEAPEALTPHGTAQKIGFGGEQAAEFLIPGAGEEKAGALAGKALPQLGRFAPVLGRLGAGALGTGAVNLAQGGSFGEGALLGAGTGAVGELGRAVAPALAESALGVTKRLRGFGKTPGEAALAEVRGIRPGTIAENARAALDDLTAQLEQHAAKSTIPTTTADAVGVVDREMHKAMQRNSKVYYDQLNGIREQLTKDLFTGQPLGGALPASKLLDLKRGIGELEKSWNPEQRGAVKGIVRRVYRALDDELDRAVPAGKAINQRISSLIPVAERAESTERGAELGQRVMGRVARHTGALAGTGLGAGLGYQRGGTEGALVGGALGLAAPEVLSAPAVQMLGARVLRSGVPQRLGRTGATQLLGRRGAE